MYCVFSHLGASLLSKFILLLCFNFHIITHYLSTNLWACTHAHARRLFYFFEKKLIICIYYNLILLHFLITKYLEVWRVLWVYEWNYFFITPLGILWLKNVVISNYNRCKLLICSQKNRRVYARAQKLVLGKGYENSNLFYFEFLIRF